MLKNLRDMTVKMTPEELRVLIGDIDPFNPLITPAEKDMVIKACMDSSRFFNYIITNTPPEGAIPKSLPAEHPVSGECWCIADNNGAKAPPELQEMIERMVRVMCPELDIITMGLLVWYFDSGVVSFSASDYYSNHLSYNASFALSPDTFSTMRPRLVATRQTTLAGSIASLFGLVYTRY